MRNKIVYGFVGLLLLLAMLNPSMKDFKEYRGIHGEKIAWNKAISKPSNWVVCSVYKDSEGEFLGVVKNFWKIK